MQGFHIASLFAWRHGIGTGKSCIIVFSPCGLSHYEVFDCFLLVFIRYYGPEGSQFNCDFPQFSCDFSHSSVVIFHSSVVIFHTVHLRFFHFSCDFSHSSLAIFHSSVVIFHTVQLCFFAHERDWNLIYGRKDCWDTLHPPAILKLVLFVLGCFAFQDGCYNETNCPRGNQTSGSEQQ